MRVVVGLGNPGPEYVWTRHNVGFMVVNTLADRWGVSFRRTELALVGERNVGERNVGERDGRAEETLLVAPQTFMNRSGMALDGLVDDENEEGLIVIYDDVDLSAGELRIRRSGGAGGHRGVASVIEHCGAEFSRVRVGVGRPPVGTDTADYVLAEFDVGERADWLSGIDRAADSVECVLDEGIQTAMNRFNGVQAP